MKLLFTLRELVINDKACELLGLNPYCVAEGANGEDTYTLTMEQAKECDLL